MSKLKTRFTIEVGMLVRGDIRRILNNLKADIIFFDPTADIEIIEHKYFLESEFVFLGTHLNETSMNMIADRFNHLKFVYEEI